MTRAQSIAYRLRWLILLVGVVCLAVGVLWVFEPVMDFGPFSRWEAAGLLGTPWPVVWLFLEWPLESENANYVIDVSIFIGVFFVTQWLFLRNRSTKR